LSPLVLLPSSHLDLVFLDILVEHSAVELFRAFISDLVGQLTTLWLNHIGFSRSYAVGLRVLTLSDTGVDLLLVLPRRVFVAYKPLCRRPVLALVAWEVVSVQDVSDLWYSPAGYTSILPALNHFPHELLKLPLNRLSLPLHLSVPHLLW
jgi:hypothetical protein